MASLGIMCHAGPFLLGTTAPDAFEPESEVSFSRHHFTGSDDRISLQKFLDAKNLSHEQSDESTWSFCYGYYCHLWLDVFYRDNADRILIERPADISDVELRSLVRREKEILNAPFVLDAAHLLTPRSDNLFLPPSLEFVDLERCINLFREVVKQSQEWSIFASDFKTIDSIRYAAFLESASHLFLEEFQITT
jgi:hypothetical protein